jgi:hypothetical protein
VFDAIIRSAVRLCEAARGTVYRFDGEMVHVVAHAGYSEEHAAAFATWFPRPPGLETPPTRTILERAIVHVPNVDVAGSASEAMQILRAGSTLAVPLLKDGV